MKICSVFIILCLGLCQIYFMGVLNYLKDRDEDKCQMTYMFEYPQFVRIHNKKIDKIYPQYELYAYSEGRLTEKARKMDFTGIPVLFIPGNKGSYKQVRSLASVALRKALNSRSPFHFDYFTVNLNEEFSALSGPLLYDQTAYVNHSIYRVLKLYKKKPNKPTSIILIGHSMGGAIAKYIAKTLPRDSDLISVIITLAAPVSSSVFYFDHQMQNFYKTVREDKLPFHTDFISIFGGYKDQLVPPYTTKVRNAYHISTTNIPLAWIGTDHVQILWCKQVVMAINRALFDMVSPDTKQLYKNPAVRRPYILNKLVKNSGTKVLADLVGRELIINPSGQYTDISRKHFTIQRLEGTKTEEWFRIKLPDEEILTIEAINLEVSNWVYGCMGMTQEGDKKICNNPFHISHISEIARSARYKRRIATISFHLENSFPKYANLSHVVFRLPPTDEPVVFHTDLYTIDERSTSFFMPMYWSSETYDLVNKTPPSALKYFVFLPNLEEVVQSFKLHIEPTNCKTDEHHAVAVMNIPKKFEDDHVFITDKEVNPVPVRMVVGSDRRDGGRARFGPNVELTLDPACQYKIRFESDFIGMVLQCVRNYSSWLIAHIAIVVLLALRVQYINFGRQGNFSLFFTALARGGKPYYVVFTARFISGLFETDEVRPYVPETDTLYFRVEKLDFVLSNLLSYMVSVAIVWNFVLSYVFSLLMLESSVNKFALKFLSRTVRFPINWSEHIMSVLQKLPFIVSVIMLAISLTACGGLALCVGSVFYFLKLSQMAQDCVEDLVFSYVKALPEKLRNIPGEIYSPFYKFYKVLCSNPEEEEERFMLELEEEENRRIEEICGAHAKNEEAENDNEMVSSSDNENENLSDDTDNKEGSDHYIEYEVAPDRDELLKREVERYRTYMQRRYKNYGQPGNHKDIGDFILNSLNLGDLPTDQEFPAYNSIFFHSSIFFLWVLIAALNVPSVLVWAHGFNHSKFLHPDPSFFPGLALSICSFSLWQLELPIKKKYCIWLSHYILFCCIVTLIYGLVSLYILNYLLTSIVVIITLHQTYGKDEEVPETTEDEENKEDGDDETKVKEEIESLKEDYENVKNKLD